MNEVTIKPTGSAHSYVLLGEKWIATVLNEYAQAVADAVANRVHTEANDDK